MTLLVEAPADAGRALLAAMTPSVLPRGKVLFAAGEDPVRSTRSRRAR